MLDRSPGVAPGRWRSKPYGSPVSADGSSRVRLISKTQVGRARAGFANGDRVAIIDER